MNNNKMLEEESVHLEETLKIIKKLIEENGISIQEATSSISEMKKYIWENIGHVDEVEVESGMYDVNNRVSSVNKDILKYQKLRKALSTPYFGRVDFERSKNGRKISAYIGLTGVSENRKFYVFDWRTPVASLFYNYGIGKASYVAPAGIIDGEIVLKRQFKIRNGIMERCIDNDINIDDELLQEILSKSSSKKMTNIVNTIQQEQNKIIRNIEDKHLIVQGIAGSGKTSVALHRIAYLLYADKELTSNNVLIFSPNNVFSEYISEVLPELGEENVLQTTFSDFSKQYVKKFKNIESFTEFIDRYYSNDYLTVDELKSIRYKLSDDFKKLLDEKVKIYKEALYFKEDLYICDEVLLADELNNLLSNKYSRFPVPERIDFIVEYVCDTLKLPYGRYSRKIRKNLLKNLNNNSDIWELYLNIVKSNEFTENAIISKESIVSGKQKLLFEDLIPLMYLYFEINGYPKDHTIKHVIIDEAQDYTLIQLFMLKNIFDRASFTILGDVNQTINPYYMYENLETINEIFDNRARYIELNKTYRSSEEIINYTNEILGLNNVCSIRKSNSQPVEHTNVEEKDTIRRLSLDVNKLKLDGIKKVAIITKSKEQTLKIYDKLLNYVNEVSLVDDKNNSEMGAVVILPSFISKGLEFDGVIVYTDDDNYYHDNSEDKHLFYVVCTRAQNKLIVYNQKSYQKKMN